MSSLRDETARLLAPTADPLSLQALASRFNCPPSLAAISSLPGLIWWTDQINAGDVKGKFTFWLRSDGRWHLKGEIKDDGWVFGDEYTFKVQAFVDGQPVTREYEETDNISAGQTHWWPTAPAPEHDERLVARWGAVRRFTMRWSMKLGLNILPDAEWAFPPMREEPGGGGGGFGV